MKLPASAFVVGTTVLLGGTPGYRLVGLRVVGRATGTPPGWGQASPRWAAATAPTFAASELVRAYTHKRVDPGAQPGEDIHEHVERLRA